MNSKKFLFILPRFHSNQVDTIKALLINNHHVDIHVSSIGSSEDHSIIKPKFLEECWLSKFIQIILRKKGTGILPYSFPNLIWYSKRIISSKYDLIILREFFRVNSFLVIIFSLLFIVRCMVVTQTKSTLHWSFFKKLLFNILVLHPRISWSSPVSSISGTPSFLHFPVNQIKEKFECKKNKITLMAIGKYRVKRKRLDYFIKQLNLLDWSNLSNNLEIIIVGSSEKDKTGEYREYLLSLIREFNLFNNIKLYSDISHCEMKNFYINTDIFVLPSTREPASISIVEALQAGCFCISSKDNGTANYIDHLKNGYLYKEEKNSLYSAMIYALKNIKIISLEKQKRSELFVNKYSYKKFINRLFLLNNLSSNNFK